MMWKNTGRGGMKGQKKSEKKRDQINRKEKWGQLIALMTGRRVMKRGYKRRNGECGTRMQCLSSSIIFTPKKGLEFKLKYRIPGLYQLGFKEHIFSY